MGELSTRSEKQTMSDIVILALYVKMLIPALENSFLYKSPVCSTKYLAIPSQVLDTVAAMVNSICRAEWQYRFYIIIINKCIIYSTIITAYLCLTICNNSNVRNSKVFEILLHSSACSFYLFT
jgi:hypothetical protein